MLPRRHLLLAALVTAVLTLTGPPCQAEPPDGPPERALVLTLKWDDTGVTVDKVDRREMPVPAQLGFPQLWSRFFELQNKDGDVCYSGPLVDPRMGKASGGPGAQGASQRLILPDMEDARHLVIYQRVSPDPDTGRKIVLERDL